jgi:MFS family permease
MLKLLIFFFSGFGFGLMYLPAIVSVTCYFEKKRSLATGIAVCGSGLGTFVFAPLTEYLIDEYGWRGAVMIIAGLVLNCAILGALFRPVPDVRESKPVSRTASACAVTYQASSETTDLYAKKDIAERDLKQGVSDKYGQYDRNALHRPISVGHFVIPYVEKVNTKPNAATSDIARLALSQPALMTTYASASEHRLKLTFGSQSLRKSSGIMYRRDIFYHGSLHNIPYHR